eukprot:TRINITY_DN15343_c0_g1_i1.p2 TRINITY_DN15343_c0_g1~~TRINITY_DN15343_c0_g1_i1.p2  ORF type:complete len:153 (-),score=31.84 TRINITY_DN15343_c0_g1_i1:92-496(-)
MSIQQKVRETCTEKASNGAWVLVNVNRGQLELKGTGTDVPSLQQAFGDNEVNFALLTLRLTLQGIPDQPRNIFLHWKGPSTSGMAKVQGNQKIQEALNLLSPNHGQLEVTNRNNFTESVIADKWGPGTGSHIID